jgi:hypothetical protein
MQLKEILSDVNLLVPNSINDQSKVRWLNQVQRQMYRDYAFPITSQHFETEPGRSLYLLPDNCDRDRIINVVVGDREYTYKSVDQDAGSYCYTIIEDQLWLYPTPSTWTDAYLNFKPRPRDLRVDMQDAKPDFPEDFHELLVLGVALRVARASQNPQLTRELQGDFDALEIQAKRKLRSHRQRRVNISRGWC